MATKTIKMHFQSLPDVMRHLETAPKLWRGNEARKTEASPSWDLSLGYAGAVKLCGTGWPDGGRDMRVIFDALPRTQGPAMIFRNAPTGERFSIGRYVTGDPYCFKKRVRDEDSRSSPIIRLAVSNGTSWRSDARCLHNYGAAIAAAVEALEAEGLRVELSVHNPSMVDSKETTRLVIGWTVKQAGDPLDMAALAFSIAHPAANRRIGFAVMETSPKAVEHAAYGIPKDLTLADLTNPPPMTIVLNGARDVNKHAATPDAAVSFVQAKIAEALAALGDGLA